MARLHRATQAATFLYGEIFQPTAYNLHMLDIEYDYKFNKIKNDCEMYFKLTIMLLKDVMHAISAIVSLFEAT